MKIQDTWLVQNLYRGLYYCELGRSNISRLYGPLPEIGLIIALIKYLFEIDFTRLQLVFIGIFCVTVFFVAGYFLKNSGLSDVDSKVRALKDPVMHEIYEASKKINGGKRI